MSMIGFCHSRTILSVPSFEDFFHSETPARDKFLSRLFGLFSEDVVRHWCGCPEAQYQNLGRPYLRPVGETKGYTLDFTLRNREAKTFVAELKCELEWDHYKYLRLTDASQLAHHTRAAFQKLLDFAKNQSAYSVTVGGKPMAVNGAVLVWGATTPAGCEAVRSTYGFADVLSVETMLHDLRQWHCEPWMARVAEVGKWCSELTEFLGGETPNGH
jgi:hypothetical protein